MKASIEKDWINAISTTRYELHTQWMVEGARTTLDVYNALTASQEEALRTTLRRAKGYEATIRDDLGMIKHVRAARIVKLFIGKSDGTVRVETEEEI